jgi:hypothetical protein
MIYFSSDTRERNKMDSAYPAAPLGEQLDRCLDLTRQRWLDEHKAGRDEDSAWTLEIVETSLSCQLKHGGRAHVQVTVISRRPFNTETEVFTLRQRGPRSWFIVRTSLTLNDR